MEVKISGWAGAKPGFQPVSTVFISPDGRFAVAEIYRGELFVAGAVRSQHENRLELAFLEEIRIPLDEPALHGFSIDWKCLQYGFFKFLCADAESGETRVHRCYFDRRLYRQKRRELHGEEEGTYV